MHNRTETVTHAVVARAETERAIGVNSLEALVKNLEGETHRIVWVTRILNINTGSNGGRPPLLPSEYARAFIIQSTQGKWNHRAELKNREFFEPSKSI